MTAADCLGQLAAIAAGWCVFAGLPAQAPVPGGELRPPGVWQRHGADLLEAEDPLLAWDAFRRALAEGGAAVESQIGLGRAHLMLGRSCFALAYAEAAIAGDRANQSGMALCVRALIRARAFDEAVLRADAFLEHAAQADPELLAARASALFRVQRIDEAAEVYRQVIARDPLHAEGHLRLGSGLLGPSEVPISSELSAAVAAMNAGDREQAARRLGGILAAEPAHPVAHRLLGEVLFGQRLAASMAASDASFRRLAAVLPVPDVTGVPIGDFVRGYDRLSPARRLMVDRTAALFSRHISRLVAVGGRHDLLGELERTTDAGSRTNLRGKRTFDGRVWDDVRGVGGIQAATGIEALDEAAQFGFDTLAHEVAHQAHFFSLLPLQRARIRSLYQRALVEGLCLDYYAASNEAEYFGQGVEAFASLAKRPGAETTHGHTRFELYAVDRELHDFVATMVDYDPLKLPGTRESVLEAAVAVALRCGRFEDAEVAASMMSPGPLREQLLEQAGRAAAAARCH